MNVAVYCASSAGQDPGYINSARELGALLAKRGHTVVYGGSEGGLMGALADAALSAGGHVTGVLPDVKRILARRHPRLTEYIYTDTLASRRTKMIGLVQAFIVLPGGLGTLDEITEVMSLASLGIINAPAAFINTLGYYEPLRQMLDRALNEGFARAEYFEKLCFADSPAKAVEFIEAYSE
ncbi:MAG: TIGR00730 family Rossman fold protein [Clostridia bacterium]|nr:TIGR00730 family Rossman fold protein [Clostridia bacterium]